MRSCKGVNQLSYYNWFSKFYVAESQTCLNTSSQIIQMWEVGKYITNNEQVSNESI